MTNEISHLTAASLITAAFGLLAGGLACGNQANSNKKRTKTYRFPVSVEVTDKEGNPVAKAPVQLDGKVVGYTGKKGEFEGMLVEKPGTEVELALGKLDGYRYPDGASTTEVLELKPSLSGKGRKGVEVLLHAEAESIKRLYLVWLKATCESDALDEEDCRGLAVRRGGETIAETDRFGTAHFHLRERSGETIEVSVESPSLEDEYAPEFTPKNPTYQFETALESTVYLLEPTFKEADDEDDGHRRHRRRRRTHRQTGGSGGGDEESGGGNEESGGGTEESGGGDEESGKGSESDDFDSVDVRPTERTSSSGSGSGDGSGSSGGGESGSGQKKKKKKDGPIDLFDK